MSITLRGSPCKRDSANTISVAAKIVHREVNKAGLADILGEADQTNIQGEVVQKLDLFACVRPVRWYTGTPSPVKDPGAENMIIFRENSEDVYAGIEWESGSDEVKKVICFPSKRNFDSSEYFNNYIKIKDQLLKNVY